MDTQAIAPNTIAFVGLCNEYCTTMETAAEQPSDERAAFLDTLLRLLPRLYICATDLQGTEAAYSGDFFIDASLDEDYYDTIRRNVENLLGEDDTYLEVFHEDMKYSDTPIAASIAEGCADLFQVFYNYLEAVRDSTDDTVHGASAAVYDDFVAYWSTTLCNLLRAINHVRYQSINS